MKYEIRTYMVCSPFREPVQGRSVISGAEDAAHVARIVLAREGQHDLDHHVIVALDARNRLPGQKATTDTVSAYLVPPREVFHAVTAFGTVTAIVAHKHPSAESTADRLLSVVEYVGIPVHDSVVVALA